MEREGGPAAQGEAAGKHGELGLGGAQAPQAAAVTGAQARAARAWPVGPGVRLKWQVLTGCGGRGQWKPVSGYTLDPEQL